MRGYFTPIFRVWDRLRSSFWFLPSIMAVCSITMAILLVMLDSLEASRFGWIADWTYAFGPESARAILSAIAGSMITVAGVTFSMTLLTLQLVSSQFGPRMLRNFMRDRGNQIVLGTFLSTFAAIGRYGIKDSDVVARLLSIMERCSRGALTSDRESLMRLHDAIKVESAALGFGSSESGSEPFSHPKPGLIARFE